MLSPSCPSSVPSSDQCFWFLLLYFKCYILTGNHANCLDSGLSFSEPVVFLQKNFYVVVRSHLIWAWIICYLMLVNTWGSGVNIIAVAMIQIPDYIFEKVLGWYSDRSLMREIFVFCVFLDLVFFWSVCWSVYPEIFGYCKTDRVFFSYRKDCSYLSRNQSKLSKRYKLFPQLLGRAEVIRIPSMF